MTVAAPQSASTSASFRRAAVLLVAWLAAAVIAGLPSDAAGTGNASRRSAHIPVVQNTGPQCFAGHAARPESSETDD